MARIYNVYEPEYVFDPGEEIRFIEGEELKQLREEEEKRIQELGYRPWEAFIKFQKEEIEGYPPSGPFEGEQVDYPFFHGSNVPPERILRTGLNPMTNLALSPKWSGMYGRYIYRIDLPRNWPLGWGAGRDEFWVVRRIPPRYISVFADREGEVPEPEVMDELHSHMDEVIGRGYPDG